MVGWGSLLLLLYREVWPDDVFGAGSMTPLAEMNTLKEIIFNPLSGEWSQIIIYYNAYTWLFV